MKRLLLISACLALALSFTACGGGGSSNTNPPPQQNTITGVTVSCPNSSLPVRLLQQCTASVQGTGNYLNTINWSTTGGSISSTGVLSAATTPTTVTVKATAAGDTTKFATTDVTITPQQQSTFSYRGVNHVSWWPGEYSSPAAAISEAAIPATGSNWTGVLVTQYMATKSSTTITANNSTPTDTDLQTAIAQLHTNGLKVMLKPHVDVNDGSWRGQITPSDVNAWFTSYNAFITHYAQLAEANNVEMLCIGTEFATMTGSANKTAWENIIAAIRSVYHGKLTYAANATTGADEFTSVSFWDSLDVLGLDGYFPLTNHAHPTIPELVSAWSHNKNGENVVQAVQNFAAAHSGKEVIFTEIGYRSVAGANMAPWDYSTTSTLDNFEQQNCYEAMYRIWGQNPSIKGHMLWAWPVNPPTATDTDYNPRGKLAQTVMINWFVSN